MDTSEMAVQDQIYAAVAKAMGAVKRVAKDSRNLEQKYDFASVDDFLAMVGPICAEHGLVTVIDEASVQFVEKQGKYGPTAWVAIAYEITTYHTSGQRLPTVRRNVEVIRSGPQAYGAAQSYILKQYYRGLLNVPTGDKDDPDHGAVAEQPAGRDDKKQGRQEAERRDWAGMSEAMILEVKERRAEAWDGPRFRADWAAMNREAPELAAQVAAEIETQKQALAEGTEK